MRLLLDYRRSPLSIPPDMAVCAKSFTELAADHEGH
jgi:hypothetical protein